MWQSFALEILRVLLNDLSDSPTYDTCKLTRLLNVSAYAVLQDVSFPAGYSINPVTGEVSPNPSTDMDFIILTAYKANCILSTAELKTEGGCSIRVTDGPSTIDTTSRSDYIKQSQKTACEMYEDAKDDYKRGATELAGQAILTPYSPGSFALRGETNGRCGYIY